MEHKNPGTISRKYKRILVTGGCGFIGSHLIDSLLQKSNTEVICIDNCFSGTKKNIEHHFKNPRFEFIRHDVINPISLIVDEIYHLACPASPVFYQHNGLYTLDTIIQGTRNMLRLASKNGAKFLLASTSEIYGDPKIHPQNESYWGNVNPIGIRSPYDEGKRISECITREYFRQERVDTKIARIFNTYGPRMLENDGRVISNFITQSLRNSPLTIYGNGLQTRSFCYVSDTVNALIKLMNTDYNNPVNIGNPDEYSIRELVDLFSKIFNKDLPVKNVDLPSDDPKMRKPDISIANVYLNWEPKINICDGLIKTIDYFRNRKVS